MKSVFYIGCAAILVLHFVSCSGGGSEGRARKTLEMRMEQSLPPTISDVRFKWVKVGDAYSEYFRFECAADTFDALVEAMKLPGEELNTVSGFARWGQAVGRGGPNEPKWWVPAPKGTRVYHKENYTKIANGSVLATWYDRKSGFGYMQIDFWD